MNLLCSEVVDGFSLFVGPSTRLLRNFYFLGAHDVHDTIYEKLAIFKIP